MRSDKISINSLVEYEYIIDNELLSYYDLSKILGENSFKKAIFLVDHNVWGFHESYLKEHLFSKFGDALIKIIPSGESSKSFDNYQRLVEEILASTIDRSTPLFAVGGGVTGDLAGFVAASLLRGLPFIQVPTTSLAMVDSSIGGKTGINSISGKNLIGAFFQPKAVLADLSLLASLPEREMLCGISETIKHGAIYKPHLIADAADWLKNRYPDNLAQLLFSSASVKIEIVAQDILEKGIRAHLNLGHTFGHAIEAALGYGTVLHGEAVFLGLLAADYASMRLLGSELNLVWDEFIPYYREVLPSISINNIEQLIPYMFKDKKALNGNINLILTEEHGTARLITCDDLSVIRDSFEYAFNKMSLSNS